ncbi:MAG: hypothetical protein LBB81_04045 [Treponema sp.]|jgi:hypothetical protein|nr:hypothetical protein [Treponema sp.]
MKSSDALVKGSFLSNGPLYSLFAVYMPLAFLAAAVFLAEKLLDTTLPAAVIIICAFTSGICASIYFDFLKDEKASRTAADIRGGIILTAVCYILSSLFTGAVTWNKKFLPDIRNILPSAGALFLWTCVISLKQLFVARKYFETYTELYKGEKLQEVLFEDSGLMQYTGENINKKALTYFLQLFLLAFLAVLCAIFKITLPLALNLLLVVILTGAVCIYGFFGIIKRELFHAAEGIVLPASGRTRCMLAMIIFTLLCFTAAVIFTPGKNILPFSLIIRFFSWLFPRRDRQFELSGKPVIPEHMTGAGLPENFPGFDENAQPSILSIIFKYFLIFMKYALIILVCAGFIRFMVAPLFNRGNVSGKLPFYRRFIGIIAEWFRETLAAIASFFAHLKEGTGNSKLRKYSAQEIRRAEEDLFGAYSPEKRRGMKQSVTLFARLIIWGNEARGAEWKPAFAPGEYCCLLAASAHETPDNTSDLKRINEGIIRCGELFEKALYSADALSDTESGVFKSLVEEITS